MILHRAIAAVLLFATTAIAPDTARAAESYDNCAGTVSSLPTTISAQGVWCLKKDLSTAITSGAAITIATNNVTIDCNDFKIGGLAAGEASQAVGIYASARQNATVRHCNVRGFYKGIHLNGSGHLVEDNRLDNNLYSGITVEGDNGLVRGNRVFDTGGVYDSARGIDSSGADIVDNLVEGVFIDETKLTNTAYGIIARSDGTQISGNVVSGLRSNLTGRCHAIHIRDFSHTVSENRLVGGGGCADSAEDTGLYFDTDGAFAFCSGNTFANFHSPMGINPNCQFPDPDDNIIH